MLEEVVGNELDWLSGSTDRGVSIFSRIIRWQPSCLRCYLGFDGQTKYDKVPYLSLATSERA